MPRQTEFERRIAGIEELVQQLETATDPAARAASQELVRALMELHGSALERMLATIRRNGAAGGTIVEQLSRDDLIASVLLLYDLHPVDLETRVRGALDKSRPYLQTHGGNVELVAIEETVVRLRMQGSCSGCPSSAVTLKLAIEQAIHEAAPDVTAILVEGQEEPHGAAAVLAALKSATGLDGIGDGDGAWQDVPDLGRLGNGATRRTEVAGREVLFCRIEETLYAYGARCPRCDADLGAAALASRSLACPGCGQTYDVVQAGRASARPDLHLDPFPILTRNGRTQVALPPPGVAAGSV